MQSKKWKDLYSMVKDHCQAAEAELRAIKVERDALKVESDEWYSRAKGECRAREAAEAEIAALKELLEKIRVRANSLRANDKDGHFGDGLSAAGAQILAIIEGEDE